jgi:major intracellular serine protease
VETLEHTKFRTPYYNVRETGEFGALSQRTGWGLNLFNVPEAWGAAYEGEGITIMVIDSGHIDHPDLIGNVQNGPNYIKGEDGKDYTGHSTHVSGIIAAKNDSSGVVGVAPKARIVTVKALDKNGVSSGRSVLQALNYAIRTRPDIVNLSLGSPRPLGAEAQNLLKKLYDLKIPVVCASGNSSNKKNIDYPARYPWTISVGAFDFKQQIAPFSNWGDALDFVAPGVDILSCWLRGRYARVDGTSQAAPFVSGIIALGMARRKKRGLPKLTVPELVEDLVKYTDDMGDAGKDKTSGYGSINVLSYVNEDNLNSFVQRKVISDLKASEVPRGRMSKKSNIFQRFWHRLIRRVA